MNTSPNQHLFQNNLAQKQIEGVVKRITFRNEETGYTVARVILTRGNSAQITVLGNLPFLIEGERVALSGRWEKNPKYGYQFRVEEYRTLLPITKEGIKNYLGSGLIRGIGPVHAERLVNHFGLQTLEIIENNPEKLLEVEGIGEKRLEMIKQAWKEQKDLKEVMLFLSQHGISPNLALKIYRNYGNQTLDVLRHNPYQIAEDVWGIGFLTADRIAQSLGIAPDEPARIEAGLKYVLLNATEEGHVFLPRSELLSRSRELLKLETNLIETVLEELIKVGHIVAEDDSLYLPPFYFAEKGLAEALAILTKVEPLKLPLDETLAQVKKMAHLQGIEYNKAQMQAISKALQSKVMVLTGGPGTGKTTTVRGIIQLFEYLGLRIKLAAPTGRAAKRLAEATGQPAKTIHRLLEFEPQTRQFKRNKEHQLSLDVLIVDEASMLDLMLAFQLVRALPPTARLILVGDVDQLPSVGPGNVLRDIIDSGIVGVVKLKEIFRQARDSVIVVNAHRINQGLFPKLERRATSRNKGSEQKRQISLSRTGKIPVKPRDDFGDFLFVQEEDAEKIVQMIVELCAHKLPQRYNYNPMFDIQVLTPMHRGPLGVNNLNTVLQQALNPRAKAAASSETRAKSNTLRLVRSDRQFLVGDKVMQLRNNYDKGVFNGDLGIIRHIDLEEQKIVIDFDKTVTYELSELDEIVHAYAITVHKSQGSEYPVVIMPISTQHYVMLQRNLLYTAVTRAKELIILIGTRKALQMALKNNQVVQRYTALKKRLQMALT
ncbi:ATP-dependent RecD-like DNA helicase [candidate division KSB1 bacterium]|nr:MAG: ATP-dependent RecD-like DNA helicase [candidate division KSB1 bacterium]